MNINLSVPTKHQMAVVASHAVVGASAVVSTLAFMGALTPDQVQQATQDVSRIVADLKDLYGAGAGLVGLGMVAYSAIKSGPFASFFRAAQDIAASPKMIAQVQAATLEQKAPVVAITDKLPEVVGVPTTNTDGGKALATAVQSSTVQVAK
jgi:hypothetical protein